MPGVRPACVANRWGQGTCSTDKEPKTSAAKEIEAKLAAMKADREKQDQLFTPLKTPK